MVVYKNTSFTTKTFYGETFQPGETKAVPGWINDPAFIRIDDEKIIESLTKIDNVVNEKEETKPAKKSSTTSVKDKSNKQGGDVDGSDNNK